MTLKLQDTEFQIGLDEYQGFADNAPVNIMYCDKKFNIVYVITIICLLKNLVRDRCVQFLL